ncbi:MAG: efflux RND transporter periplasmic adaptor subunit [Bacteroidales bacterium]|nr:efflux RND transporter periplasmic adaptor subunit [Bacteroidales bacterium]
MTVRKTWIIAILVLVLGGFGYKYISGLKKSPKRKTSTHTVVAPYLLVKNAELPLIVEGAGQLIAKNRIEIYSEVNGVLQKTKKDFRAGMPFRKGELMISVDATEHKANLYAQRSEFQNLVTSLLPDLKLEFPEEIEKWDNYLNSISVEKSLPPIPETISKKEKFFITGRKVYSTYYGIKNLEARLEKYSIRAPFTGIVTQSNINPGGLVRTGQKIGVFSNTDLFELELSVKASDAAFVKVGDKATITTSDNGQQWPGFVSRVNAAIDLNTQTVLVFIETRGEGLKEGMFPKAHIKCGTHENAYEIPRNLLSENKFIYTIAADSTVVRTPIHPIRFLEKSVIVKDLPDQTKMLGKNIPGIFSGMKVIPVLMNKQQAEIL